MLELSLSGVESRGFGFGFLGCLADLSGLDSPVDAGGDDGALFLLDRFVSLPRLVISHGLATSELLIDLGLLSVVLALDLRLPLESGQLGIGALLRDEVGFLRSREIGLALDAVRPRR